MTDVKDYNPREAELCTTTTPNLIKRLQLLESERLDLFKSQSLLHAALFNEAEASMLPMSEVPSNGKRVQKHGNFCFLLDAVSLHERHGSSWIDPEPVHQVDGTAWDFHKRPHASSVISFSHSRSNQHHCVSDMISRASRMM